MGGLTLALSRESSVKGGQATCASRERSVRDGSVREGSARSGSANPAASPLERSVSGGQRTYRGLPLADSRPGQPSHHLRRLEEAFSCGSAEWDRGQGAPLTAMVGLQGTGGQCGAWQLRYSGRLLARSVLAPAALPVTSLLPSRPQLDACEQPAPPAAGLHDPFAPPVAGLVGRSRGSRSSSQPVTCRPSEALPEDQREKLLHVRAGEVRFGVWKRCVAAAEAALLACRWFVLLA